VATVGARSARARWLWWLGAALGVALVAVAIVMLRAQAASDGLVGGGIVDPPQAAPNFTLTDQHGHQDSLVGLRGKPIALTFVYTHCPDACPLIASNMHAAYLRLGGDASKVAMVAVTVDPERDDVAQVLQFSQDRGLADEWLFLTGTRPELERVWSSFGIDARSTDTQGNPATPSASDPELVEHSAPIYLIDKHGNVRAMLPIDFKADDLATDLSRLLAES
jgi:protein SCO1